MPIRHTSIKEVRKDRLKGFMDRRLIEAMGHPVREHILAVLNERPASPTEIGDELELDVSAFYKHVQVLERLGCIECVGTRRVRLRMGVRRSLGVAAKIAQDGIELR